jgi:hypothetical protein
MEEEGERWQPTIRFWSTRLVSLSSLVPPPPRLSCLPCVSCSYHIITVDHSILQTQCTASMSTSSLRTPIPQLAPFPISSRHLVQPACSVIRFGMCSQARRMSSMSTGTAEEVQRFDRQMTVGPSSVPVIVRRKTQDVPDTTASSASTATSTDPVRRLVERLGTSSTGDMVDDRVLSTER